MLNPKDVQIMHNSGFGGKNDGKIYNIKGNPDWKPEPPKPKKEHFVSQNGKPYEFQFYPNFELASDLYSQML